MSEAICSRNVHLILQNNDSFNSRLRHNVYVKTTKHQHHEMPFAKRRHLGNFLAPEPVLLVDSRSGSNIWRSNICHLVASVGVADLGPIKLELAEI